jgi:capsid protein
LYILLKLISVFLFQEENVESKRDSWKIRKKTEENRKLKDKQQTSSFPFTMPNIAGMFTFNSKKRKECVRNDETERLLNDEAPSDISSEPEETDTEKLDHGTSFTVGQASGPRILVTEEDTQHQMRSRHRALPHDTTSENITATNYVQLQHLQKLKDGKILRSGVEHDSSLTSCDSDNPLTQPPPSSMSKTFKVSKSVLYFKIH